MKYVLIVLLLAVGLEVPAQKRAEATIRVDGVCGMCKNRIEKALDVPGVLVAEWDKNTKLLYIVYRPAKISEDSIHMLINGVGHDTEKSKAPDDVYQRLADCCHYRDENNVHKRKNR
ncbi:MAG: heavy-metal-associated domain-containing protein [Thermaurantimonas sp.]